MRYLWIILIAGNVMAQTSATNTAATYKRRMTKVEEKAAIVYYESTWIKYRIAQVEMFLQTPLGPAYAYTNAGGQLCASPRYFFERDLEILKKTPAKFVTERKPYIIAGTTNAVTDKDVVWDEILDTNKTSVVIMR